MRYTRHARERMKDRRVTETDVNAALSREIRRTAGEPGTIWIWGYAGSRVLKVCRQATEDLVRTVAWGDE